MHREAHHIIETAVDRSDSGATNPFLNAIGAGFVEGAVFVDIPFYFLAGNGGKSNFRACGEADYFILGSQTHAGSNSVGAILKLHQHIHGILQTVGFSVDLAIKNHNSVGRNDKFIILYVGSISFSLEA